jgi:hypothetical protein
VRWFPAASDHSAIAQSPAEDGSTMRNFVAPLGFTLLSAWVVVLFVLAHNTP